MTADLTFNSVAFKKAFDEKDGSERRSITRGVNTPDVLSVKHQDYIDTKTKVKGRRHVVRVDRSDIDAAGVPYTSSVYVVMQIPAIENTTDWDVLTTTFRAMVADGTIWTGVPNNES
jgi:hypothetical protein